MTARRDIAANWMRIFCAVVLLSLGFGHQSLSAAAPPDAHSEAYRLPDGMFADICSEGGHGHKAPAARPLCEVCLLAASVILPPPSGEASSVGKGIALDNPLRPFPGLPGTSTVGRPKSRAPPSPT
ncbi:hypothetical protein [Rhizobium terrae]|uniref:hypothetical protein n=1 Tax=Rhizobium terrae TaxID=2171756 RepID=UPI000E3C54C4|nr:hypothetical protein [Rhizobium terrae]